MAVLRRSAMLDTSIERIQVFPSGKYWIRLPYNRVADGVAKGPHRRREPIHEPQRMNTTDRGIPAPWVRPRRSRGSATAARATGHHAGHGCRPGPDGGYSRRMSTTRTEDPTPSAPAPPAPAEGGGAGERWLLLVFQLPSKPAYLRVKVWRRLQALGAVALKNAAYALPATAEAQEDFGWLAKEIAEAGGEPLVCEARLVEGMTDAEVRALFDRARDAEYEALAEEARQLAAELDEAARSGEGPGGDARSRLARLRSRLDQAVAIDFFG